MRRQLERAQRQRSLVQFLDQHILAMGTRKMGVLNWHISVRIPCQRGVCRLSDAKTRASKLGGQKMKSCAQVHKPVLGLMTGRTVSGVSMALQKGLPIRIWSRNVLKVPRRNVNWAHVFSRSHLFTSAQGKYVSGMPGAGSWCTGWRHGLCVFVYNWAVVVA